jgi:hypothetical protein
MTYILLAMRGSLLLLFLLLPVSVLGQAGPPSSAPT